MTKLLIAGSRTLDIDLHMLGGILLQLGFDDWNKLEIVHGGANGVDKSADKFADHWKLKKKVFLYKSELGKAGGPVRNTEMGKYSDELVLIWDGTSKGSLNMLETMKKLKKPVYEIILKCYN